MDKIIERTRRVIAQRKRKLDFLAKKTNPAAEKSEREERLVANSFRRVCVKAKQYQREDWRKGLLAPRRDVGAAKFSFGTVPEIMESRPMGASHAPYHEIHPGERVVILVGRSRGRIGIVDSVDKDTKSCIIKGFNQIYREVPAALQAQLKYNTSTVLTQMPYRLCDVRLVHRVGDRDVIVDYREKKYILGKGHVTLIPGTDIVLPEPEKELPDLNKYDSDTEIYDVEQPTEIPRLTSSPFPTQVVDELRNKFSRFRTRHDPAYVNKIEFYAKFDADQADLRQRSALTPGDELRLMWKLYRRDAVLTDDMLERIGRVMVAPASEKGALVRKLAGIRDASGSSRPVESPSPSSSS